MPNKPYLIFIGDVDSQLHAKTAFGVRDWSRNDCVGQWRLPGCAISLDLPDLEPRQAFAAGARSLLIGVAMSGGRIPPRWVPCLLEAVDAGLDIVSGMHTLLETIPGLADAAKRRGTALVNVRVPPRDLTVGTGAKRSGKRLLTVGSDCAIGKKYTALCLTKALKNRGVKCDFRATGQTGILIAGGGMPIDAVVADFISGAAERLSPPADPDHWDVIEGQGSITHPSFAAVTLGLIHGSQPDALVLCHDPTRTHLMDLPQVEILPLQVLVQQYLQAARLTNPNARLVGVSLNTGTMSSDARATALAAVESELGVPAFDPLKTSCEAVINRLLSS